MSNSPIDDHVPLPNTVIAVVGCDGTGKSRLTNDIEARLCSQYAIERFYLGQDSGNILSAIVRVPLIGKIIGRFLVGKSARAHAKDDQPASPDTMTALVIFLLSQWRRHKFQKMVEVTRQGVTAITDRYPQAEIQGFHFDGPGLNRAVPTNGLVRWLAAREFGVYQQMANYRPALVVRLNIDAETAHARKPDHKLATLRKKAAVIPTLGFNGARILDLDARRPYPEVLGAALSAIETVMQPASDTANSAFHPRDLIFSNDGLRA